MAAAWKSVCTIKVSQLGFMSHAKLQWNTKIQTSINRTKKRSNHQTFGIFRNVWYLMTGPTKFRIFVPINGFYKVWSWKFHCIISISLLTWHHLNIPHDQVTSILTAFTLFFGILDGIARLYCLQIFIAHKHLNYSSKWHLLNYNHCHH